MTLKIVNRICYTMAIVSILTAVVCGLFLIWGDYTFHDGWRFLSTSLVLFLGSVATIGVNQMLLRGRNSRDV